jgi:hypothetical protein
MEEAEFIEIEISVDSDEKANILAELLSEIQYPTSEQLGRMLEQLRQEFAQKRAREFLGENPDSSSNQT